MSERSSESDAEWINDELRDYEGFPAILSLLQRTEDDFGRQPRPRQLSSPDEERAAQQAAFDALIADPEIAELVQRIQELDDERRSRALNMLFPSSWTENSAEV